MKIQPFGTSGINPYKQYQPTVQQPKSIERTQSDQLHISDRAKELQQKSVTSVEREQRMEQLKVDVQSGNYTVNQKEVARSLVDFYKTTNRP